MVAKRRGGHVHLWPLARPWAALALALGTALLAYYAYLGIRYLDASQDVTSLTGEARRIASALQVAPPNEEALEMEMESETLGLKALDSAFGREGGNDLIAILSQLAHETPVGLTSIAVGEPKPAPFSTADFTQPGPQRQRGWSPQVSVPGSPGSTRDGRYRPSHYVPIGTIRTQLGL